VTPDDPQWPPGGQDAGGPAPPGKPGHNDSAATKHLNTSSINRGEDTAAGLRRRREATWRLPPLCRCRDPWLCRYRCVETSHLVSEQTVDAYRNTVLHLRACGLLAAPNIPAMRVLSRRSIADRELMDTIAERWELAS
jgi:hypothetical protein